MSPLPVPQRTRSNWFGDPYSIILRARSRWRSPARLLDPPCFTPHEVPDRSPAGFGVRFPASGRKRDFIRRRQADRSVSQNIGSADTSTEAGARWTTAAWLAVIPVRPEAPPASVEKTPFETVAEEVFRRYRRNWKPRTIAVNRVYLRNQIMPWFRGRPVADITRREVQRWFAALHATPAAADRSLPILSLILRQAEIYGHRTEDTNPCAGLRRYRRRGRERFLTVSELRRLGVALAAQEAATPLPAAVVRLLLLTGCRQSEVRTLQWQDYREGHLFLRDSKTGPRAVWLSSPARSVLDRLPRTDRWIFPASKGTGPMSAETLYGCWRTMRTVTGLPEIRLHDLRHSYASFALQQGETVLAIGRLLGHRDPATTLKYTHFADTMVRDAVEAVGVALEG